MISETLKVKGMHCHSCEILLEEAISEIKGVKSAKADTKKGTVKVSADSYSVLGTVKEAIRKEGYSTD